MCHLQNKSTQPISAPVVGVSAQSFKFQNETAKYKQNTSKYHSTKLPLKHQTISNACDVKSLNFGAKVSYIFWGLEAFSADFSDRIWKNILKCRRCHRIRRRYSWNVFWYSNSWNFQSIFWYFGPLQIQNESPNNLNYDEASSTISKSISPPCTNSQGFESMDFTTYV